MGTKAAAQYSMILQQAPKDDQARLNLWASPRPRKGKLLREAVLTYFSAVLQAKSGRRERKLSLLPPPWWTIIGSRMRSVIIKQPSKSRPSSARR